MRSVYVGPFAEWVVSPDRAAGDTTYTLTGGALSCTPDEGFESEVEGPLQIRRCLIPDEDRPEQSQRKMFFTDACIVEDLASASPRDELDWFSRAFKKELEAMAKYYGNPPTIQWGLVAWLS